MHYKTEQILSGQSTTDSKPDGVVGAFVPSLLSTGFCSYEHNIKDSMYVCVITLVI